VSQKFYFKNGKLKCSDHSSAFDPLAGDTEIRNSNIETNLNDKRQMTKTQETRPWPDFASNFEHWGFDIVSDFGFRHSGFQFLHDSTILNRQTI